MHIGATDATLHAARCVLVDAARSIDAGHATGDAGHGRALRVRTVVARAAEEVLRRTAHALGPGPLATEEEHTRRVADLELYVRQWHAERDEAALGSWVRATEACPGDRAPSADHQVDVVTTRSSPARSTLTVRYKSTVSLAASQSGCPVQETSSS